MIDCISVENMRQSDAYTISNFISGRDLMYRAAYGVFKAAKWQGSTAIVVGSGNNGGDGFALACILNQHGFDCTVITMSHHSSSDSAFYAEQAKAANIPIKPFEPGCLDGFSTVVDCLLGTGFQGNLRVNYRTAIEAINASNTFVVSVDINSGMNGDTGEAELAVHSDLTVTIGYVKRGLISEEAGTYIKNLVCADIGIQLIKKEEMIIGPKEVPVPGSRRCPPWLNMNTIHVTSI